jgi:hypothetical protein
VVLGYGRVAAQRKSEIGRSEREKIELARRVFRGVSSGDPCGARGSVYVVKLGLVARNAVLSSPDFTPPVRFPTSRLCRPSYTRLLSFLPSLSP